MTTYKKSFIGRNLLVSLLAALFIPVLVGVVPWLVLGNTVSVSVGSQVVSLSEFVQNLSFQNVLILYCVAFIVSLVFFLVCYELIGKNFQDGSEEEISAASEHGVVKWFNVSKGFGFITRDSGEDVFVHFRSISDRRQRMLSEGQRVQFNIVESDKGLQADNVSILR